MGVVTTGICHTDIYAHAGRGIPVVVERVGADGFAADDHVVLSGGMCGGLPQMPHRATHLRPRGHARRVRRPTR
ncbi:hypothetical protein [Streptomyces hokutonensis]|uniref:hypothetical protein n=1 Tax=Streptomyces hokutonensis TaxID=1306990 RepID=UPI00368FB318